MSSNEHPDMSGNPADAPYVCEKCGHQFTDDAKLCGSFFSTETILCSQECSVEYDYAIAERLTADNARLTEKLAKHREYLLDHKAVIEDKRERLRACRAENARLKQQLEFCVTQSKELAEKNDQFCAGNWQLLASADELAKSLAMLELENGRLRELLREVLEDSQDDDCVWIGPEQRDRIKAAIEKGE